jgi:hypothetical protein
MTRSDLAVGASVLPARTHAHAAELLRRPFAPGAIGFPAMMRARPAVGFADPTSWRCSARFCWAWGSCPGGAGL